MAKKKKGIAQQLAAYTSGVPQRKLIRVGRNEPCPCGSGKKFKLCHEAEGEAFLQKLTAKLEKERILQEQKETGKPWYKRLFSSVSS